jgi:glycine/D-amino acid oxidase-like deaminating enzyme
MDPAYGGSWYADTVATTFKWPALDRDLKVDVCVVGGGLAGLTVAYEIAKEKRSVVLLEANRVCSGASGRNGGFVIPGFALEPHELIKSVGPEAARQLWRLSISGVDYVRRTIAQWKMCGVNPIDGLLVVRRTNNLATAKADANAYTQLGTPSRVWNIEKVRGVLASNAYFQGVEVPTAFHIHPLNYALGLSRAVKAAGGCIFEGSSVTKFYRDRMSVDVRSSTTKGSVSALNFVFAQGADAKSLLGYAQQVFPLRSHVAVTERLGARLSGLIEFKGAIFDTRAALTYYRIVDSDRLLWGGPITFGDPSGEQLVRMMRNNIAKDFPALSNVEFSHVWTGTIGFLSHKMPLIDEVFPGVWVLNAFGGHGLNTTAVAGELVAKAIIQHDKDWLHFARFRRGLTLPGHLGRIAAYGFYLGYWVYDRLEEQLGRYRASTG